MKTLLSLASAGAVAACWAAFHEPKRAPGRKSAPAPLISQVVGIRSDGLAYAPLTLHPFNGEATFPYPNEPWKLRRKESYREGQRDGDTVEFFRNGTTKSVQSYRRGMPEYAAIYHKNGNLKMELKVRTPGGLPGLYQRWLPDGRLECSAGLDEAQHWHGDYRKWTPDGVLRTHYRFKNGVLREVVREEPEDTVKRKAAGMHVVPGKETQPSQNQMTGLAAKPAPMSGAMPQPSTQFDLISRPASRQSPPAPARPVSRKPAAAVPRKS